MDNVTSWIGASPRNALVIAILAQVVYILLTRPTGPAKTVGCLDWLVMTPATGSLRKQSNVRNRRESRLSSLKLLRMNYSSEQTPEKTLMYYLCFVDENKIPPRSTTMCPD